MTGTLTIAGLGPGDAALVTPEVSAALADATDVLGYAPYVARVPARDGLRLHPSDNRQELQRASEALKLAAEGAQRGDRLLWRSRRVRDGGGRI
jgi:precorrin-3B C17-methyltransferase